MLFDNTGSIANKSVTKIVGIFNFIEQITYFTEKLENSKLMENIRNFLYTCQQASNLRLLLASGKFYSHLRVIYLLCGALYFM